MTDNIKHESTQFRAMFLKETPFVRNFKLKTVKNKECC